MSCCHGGSKWHLLNYRRDSDSLASLDWHR